MKLLNWCSAKQLDLLVVACGSFLEVERLQHTQLTKNELRTIKHYHKFFLYDKNESWKKKNTDSCFELFVKIIVNCEITAKFFQCCFISETHILIEVFDILNLARGFIFQWRGGGRHFSMGRPSSLAMFWMIHVSGITAKFLQCCFISETNKT